MTLPDKLTFLRLILTPFLFVVYALIFIWNKLPLSNIWLLWIVFGVIEVSDFLDGYLARKLDQVTNRGKIMDPFADVFSRLTLFFCFTIGNIIPIWAFLIFFWRESSMQFLRTLAMGEGIVIAATVWGKLKAVFYFIASLVGLFYISASLITALDNYINLIKIILNSTIAISLFLTILSFALYWRGYIIGKNKK